MNHEITFQNCFLISVIFLGKMNQFGGAVLTMLFHARVSGHHTALRIEVVGTRTDPHIAGNGLATYNAQFMPVFWSELVEKYSKYRHYR